MQPLAYALGHLGLAALVGAALAACTPAPNQATPPGGVDSKAADGPGAPTAAEDTGLRDEYAGARPVRRLEITATDYELTPTRITARPTDQLEITYRNRGSSMHRLEFHLLDGEVVEFGRLEPGVDSTRRFAAPATPGSYRFYCPVSKHDEQGMEGVLIVEDAEDPAAAAEDEIVDEAPESHDHTHDHGE